MKEKEIKIFLKRLGVKDSDIQTARGYVNSPCPFAKWTHQSGKDSHPSFGVKINDSDESIYVCFGCSPEASRLSGVLHNLWMFTGEYPKELADFFLRNEIFGNPEKASIVSDVWESDVPWKEALEPIPPYVLVNFPLLQNANNKTAKTCMAYFQFGRKVHPTVVFHAGVRYEPDKRNVIYPMTSMNGDVFLLRARSIFKKAIWTISPELAGFPQLKFHSLRESGALFGLHLVDWSKPVMLVEGGEDALRLMTLGYWNVVASLTTGFTEEQINNLLAAPALIVGYDDDKAGNESFSRILRGFRGRIPIFRVHWRNAGKGLKDEICKDGGDLASKEQLAPVLSNMEVFV
jgi:hypothetical protein